jgi:DNA polymerase II small subunit
MKEKIKEMLEKGVLPTLEKVDHLLHKSSNVEIIQAPNYTPQKITIKDFHKADQQKYSVMKNFLMNRAELQGAVSISRAPQLQAKNTTIVAMVYDISKLPTGTLKMELEDPSGTIIAIISSKNEELIKKASFVTKDEVLGFIGGCAKGVFFVNEIVWPDIPQKQIPTADEDVYVAFLADTHIGSNVFLKEEFERFIAWLNGKVDGTKHKEIVNKIRYVLFCGDVVDGVGIYPQQDRELVVSDIHEQYDMFINYIKQIPKHMQVVICPGTHEGVRLEEPKPKLPKELAGELYDLDNVTLVTDPAVIRLHRSNKYSGITVLMYHGDSFDYYINEIEPLRLLGGYDKGSEVHKYLLQRRCLSPTYGGQELLPMKENPLILYQIPDVLFTGHIHKSDLGTYKGVLCVCASCFQGKTAFQEKLGHHPDPGKVILLNLRNLKFTVLDFNKD